MSGSAKASTGEEVKKHIVYDLTRLLVTLVDEVASLQGEVVDVIIRQFLRIDPRTTQEDSGKTKKNAEAHDGKQGTLMLKEYPPAYNLAKAICVSCPDKMTTLISVYFSNVMMDASAAVQADKKSKSFNRRISGFDESDDENEDTQQLSKAHKLIRELWRACPDVLQNVVTYLETELTAESVSLRLLATCTLGDIIAGIGVAGLPPQPSIDPSTYPPTSYADSKREPAPLNPLLAPMSPKPFSQTHPSAYELFLSRKQDKSSSVRASWTTAIGRVLLTSAGGIGLDEKEEQMLLKSLAQMLGDADERVRVSAIRAVACFGFADIILRLGRNGSVSEDGSILAMVSERLTDRKSAPRAESMALLSRLWGASAGDIENGVEDVVSAIADAPRKIFSAFYTGDPEIHQLIDSAIFENLLPIGYPPIKAKSSKSDSQRQRTQAGDKTSTAEAQDPDKIRVRRILTLIKCLEGRSRTVFFALQHRQVGNSKLLTAYLEASEKYNGGVVEDDEVAAKSRVSKVIEMMSKKSPEPSRIAADLWKFAKMNDRRNYHLVRCTIDPKNDYRTVVNAIKELTKRLNNGSHGSASLLDTIKPLLHQSSLLIYNRSHIPSIIEISRTDEKSLAATAHEVLKDIATRNPEILKSHMKEMCSDLQTHVPSATQEEQASAPDTLKACAGFAARFPDEIPKDRKFLQAMVDYALQSTSPRAAKHAVSILLSASPKKELHASELMRKALKDCTSKSPRFLTRLSTISQLCLLTPSAATDDADSDAIIEIALNSVLLHNDNPTPIESGTDPEDAPYQWSTEPDAETTSKVLALKILVNRGRSQPRDESDPSAFTEIASPIIRVLSSLVTNNGELQKDYSTPATQKPHLRLAAAQLLLKLAAHRRDFEVLINAELFNKVALVVQDRLSEVRAGFVAQLKKYLATNKLFHRWYTVLYLLAFEPEPSLRAGTMSWLKSRTIFFAKQQQAQIQKAGTPVEKEKLRTQQNTMELMLARLLSLLAHHPDFPIIDTDSYIPDLTDFARYIIFYLSTTANEENLSLVFHVAQRVKQARDGITETEQERIDRSERLYILSDLAQVTIRIFADALSHQKGHAAGINLLQTWPGKLGLPAHLFKALPNHETAIDIAEKSFLPKDESFEDDLEKLVRGSMKSGSSKTAPKKRKADVKREKDGDEQDELREPKRAKKTNGLPIRSSNNAKAVKTPRTKKKRKSSGSDAEEEQDIRSSEQPSRKSARKSGVKTANVSYAEVDSSEDDREMERYQETEGDSKVQSSAAASDQGEDEDLPNGEEQGKANLDKEDADEVGNSGVEDDMEVDDQSIGSSPTPQNAKRPPRASGARTSRTTTPKRKANGASSATKVAKTSARKTSPESLRASAGANKRSTIVTKKATPLKRNGSTANKDTRETRLRTRGR